MATNSLILRRPLPTEYGSYYEGYVSLVPEDDVITVLRNERELWVRELAGIPAGKVDYRYAPEKWTIRQVLGHVIDM
ncbi:MAG TPA: DinB family protein, partial [Candidatus Krumholzibacteria bacterium]